MATSIIERPHIHSFSANEIRYILQVSDPATLGCAVEIEIYSRAVGGTASVLAAFTLYPPNDGLIYCHVRDFLKPLLSHQLPNTYFGNPIETITTQVAYYFIRYRQITAVITEPEWITDETNELLVMLGGIEQRKFDRNNFFVKYIPEKLPFMTWQPTRRFVFADMHHWLTYFMPDALSNFNVVYRVVYTDGSFEEVVENHTVATDAVLFRIQTGANDQELHAINVSKTIHYYDVKIVDEIGNILANPYRFYIEYNPIYNFNDITCFNSLGGMDTIRIKGEVSRDVNIITEDLQHIIYKDVQGSRTPQYQFSQTNISKRDIYKGDAGFLHTPDQQEALVEFLVSKGVYENILSGNNKWIRILNIRKSHDLGSSGDKKWSFPVEWTYAYEDEVFTPAKMYIGEGRP